MATSFEKTEPILTPTTYDVLIIGAGISGINAAYRIQTECPHQTYAILESRQAIGGTWDLFKYPGIRSDSDLHTFGFPWRPWTEQRSIADGASILSYIRDTAATFGIDQRIRFSHKVLAADWRSDSQAWFLEVDNAGRRTALSARFIILATGYYDYNEALPTRIPGLENFKGTTVHPQFWPSDLDYAGKRVVIIGSGATAVTLLPILAQDAQRVTMLQRSPGYVLGLPRIDATGDWIRRWLPEWLAFRLVRWKFLVLPFLFFHFCRAFPNAARRVIRRNTVRQLPKNVPHDPHFQPAYNPWEQRLCVAPDGDFYGALREGRAEVATGQVKNVVEDGVELESGEKISADMLVTATGLKILIAGGMRLAVDGEEYRLNEKYMWKGVMLQDMPNGGFVLGYTNASWTLGSDATAQHICRLLKRMEAEGVSSVVPRVDEEGRRKLIPGSPFNLSSTYIQRAEGAFPKAGNLAPWKARTNYFSDLWEAKFGEIGVGLQFYRVSTQ